MSIVDTHIINVLFISCCVPICIVKKTVARESQFCFDHLQLPGGDQADFIDSIAEDSFGFMWFSTWNGLYRYDGYCFTHYTHYPYGSTSLSANWIEAVYVDGIPEEIKDKILQPFFTTIKRTAGTGPGLSNANDSIKAHWG